MIDIENAKKELIKHVEQQKINNPYSSNKLEHVMRVSNICRNLAEELELTEEQIQLAELIGLLHDIGRFEQYKIVDKTIKFNHGEAGVKILKKDNYLRKYVKETKYDDIIYTAIYEHNRYELTQGLEKDKELFCKIIKDADKIDIIYEGAKIYWNQMKDIEEIENGKLSKKMLENFYQYQLADVRNKVSKIDEIVRFTSYIFDINFDYSFKVLKENNNIIKMIDRFAYKDIETKQEMKKVKEIANQYILNKTRV